jgi:hypothetical protein
MKLLLEQWRKLLEGDVVQGPWTYQPPAPPPEEPSDEINPNAIIANEIEHFIIKKMKDSAPEGVNPSDHWSPEQWEVFDEVNALLDKLFPSGDEIE